MARRAMKVWPLVLVVVVILVVALPPTGQADPGPGRFDRFTVNNLTPVAVDVLVEVVHGTDTDKYGFRVARGASGGFVPYQIYDPEVKEVRCKVEGQVVSVKAETGRFLIAAGFTYGKSNVGEATAKLCGEALQDNKTVVANERP